MLFLQTVLVPCDSTNLTIFFFFHLLDHLFRCDPGPYSKSICCQLPLLGAPASATAGGHVRWREEVARNRRGILHHPAAYIVTRVLVATSASDSSQRSETEKHFLTCCCFFFTFHWIVYDDIYVDKPSYEMLINRITYTFGHWAIKCSKLLTETTTINRYLIL